MEENREKILAIIPAYNEQDTVGKVVKYIKKVDSKIDILVIDDGSTDRTVQNSKSAGAKVISLSFNMGYGVAIQTGYKYAFERGYDFVVQLDGDGQHNPGYIPNLLKEVISGKADLVLGSRFINGVFQGRISDYLTGKDLLKKLGIRLFASLASVLIGFKITDPTSGYQVFNRSIVTFLTNDIFPCDYPDADLIVMIHRAGFRLKELPVIMHERNNGVSMHSGLKPVYYVFKMILSIFMTMLRKSPIPP